jgi:phage shock protein C
MALKRNTENKVIAGVCSGLAEYFELDTTVMRLIFVIAFIFWGVGPLLYLILWLLMPKK